MFGLARGLVSIWLKLFFKVSVVGVNNLPTQGGAILCANHASSMDLVLLGVNIKRKIKWIAKVELFKNPFIARILTGLGAFPVKRGKGDVTAVKTIYNLLSEGEIVGIFPEGKRVRDIKDRPDVKRGFVSFAFKSKAPIVPASIVYGWGPLKKSKLFSRIRVIFHEPVVLDFSREYANEEMESIGKEIMGTIYSEMDI